MKQNHPMTTPMYAKYVLLIRACVKSVFYELTCTVHSLSGHFGCWYITYILYLHCKKRCAEVAHLDVLFECLPKLHPFAVLFLGVLLQLMLGVVK